MNELCFFGLNQLICLLKNLLIFRQKRRILDPKKKHKMEFSAEISNSFKLHSTTDEHFIVSIWSGPGYTYGTFTIVINAVGLNYLCFLCMSGNFSNFPWQRNKAILSAINRFINEDAFILESWICLRISVF